MLIGGVAVYAWSKERSARSSAPLGAAADDLRREARSFGAEAKEKLVEVGQDIGDAKLARDTLATFKVLAEALASAEDLPPAEALDLVPGDPTT